MHQGVVWLFFATIAEVPPVVGLARFLAPFPFTHRSFYVAGPLVFEFER
jgi:hypothetical protein